ncbi:MAG: hypothetical protein LBB62_10220 [Proteiniphilum sp.]|jgi:hypothetical protein|nr:hypothetical protein [Proteiniphilum sp.]
MNYQSTRIIFQKYGKLFIHKGKYKENYKKINHRTGIWILRSGKAATGADSLISCVSPAFKSKITKGDSKQNEIFLKKMVKIFCSYEFLLLLCSRQTGKISICRMYYQVDVLVISILLLVLEKFGG